MVTRVCEHFKWNPPRCCHLIYSLIGQLNLLIPKLQEQSECQATTGSTEVLCHSLYDRFVSNHFHKCAGAVPQ